MGGSRSLPSSNEIKDVRRTYVHAYTHTPKMREMEKGEKEKEKKEARKEKDSHIRSKIKDTRLQQHTERKTIRTSGRK